jgi:diphthine-ammonia ligase
MSGVAVLYSGGKDSTFTIDILKRRGMQISCLITVFSENADSYMLHTSNINLVKLSAKALRIPIVLGQTQGRKEDELEDIERTVAIAQSRYDFDAIGCGGISSVYQKTRIQRIAENRGLGVICPLWGIDQKKYLKELLESKYDFILTSVSAAGLDDSWLGKRIDKNRILELTRLSDKYGFNPALEGGEGETIVLDCPIFKQDRLKILESKTVWNGYNGSFIITRACLDKK